MVSRRAQPWLTAAALASELGVDAVTVSDTLRDLGVERSVHNSRGEDAAREYSPGVQLLVKRELRSRGRVAST